MADALSNGKPCTVNTGRGFSVLYKNRLLYSKYNPEKSILQTIQSLTILPGTLILCCSPALWYGIEELKQKLPENCMIAACEADKALFEFEKEQLKKQEESTVQNNGKNTENSAERFLFLTPEQYINLPFFLENSSEQNELKLPPAGTFKRVIRIDFSAGIQFSKPLYEKIFLQCQACISQFWKNRLTLVRFGRLYSRNLFQNLSRLKRSNSFPLEKISGTISKPIVICGTGESLEKTALQLQDKNLREHVYILAVDASLPVLTAYGIRPDGVAGVESQLAIEKNYIGTLTHPFTFFADITSRPHTTDLVKGRVCYFSSEYDKNQFITEIKKEGILPKVIAPLGSVGLAAIQLALLLRSSQDIPIYVTGLDFSYSAGKTHANNSASQIAWLSSSNRISGCGNYGAAFSESSSTVSGKNNTKVITTAALSGYAKSVSVCFSSDKNLFDIGQSGLELGIPHAENWQDAILKKTQHTTAEKKLENNNSFNRANGNDLQKEKITLFLEKEENALKELKNLLVNGDQNLSAKEFTKKIAALIRPRNYLYLHFPDGYTFSTDLSFLKRVRSEIDFFLKDIQY